MNNDYSKIKYFVYARKSSEGDERQVQSIPDQIRENDITVKRYGVKVVDVLTEEGSAKEPGKRPIFDQMLMRIKKGEANGIICWNLNRLSRNPVDSGKLQWMLQQEVIQSILTPNREYKPSDNAIIFSVESGSANQFILDMKVGVRRGINSKIKKGLAPILAPLGYLNTKHEVRGENYIIKDPERFDLVKKAWGLMLTGEYTIPKLLKIVNGEWGLRTRKSKHRGGNPINKSTMYNMLTNIFYTGLFLYKGEIGNGTHEPMITMDQFDLVQKLLGRYGKPRAKTHFFTYTGVMTCGECKSGITACEKTKLIKTKNVLKDYKFYHCSHRKQGTENCSQRKFIPEAKLEKMIRAKIDKYTISPKFRDWALLILQEVHSKDADEQEKIYKSQLNELETIQRELDNLITMRMRELIDDDQYSVRKKILSDKIVILKKKTAETQAQAYNWLEHAERAFNFACDAKAKFDDPNTSPEDKKAILITLGWNHTIINEKLLILQAKWLEKIEEKRNSVEEEIYPLELEKMVASNTEQPISKNCPILRDRPDLNRQPPACM